MRTYAKKGAFSATAVAGTYVVFLGFNADKPAPKGLLGFAIKRTDHTENEEYWLQGMKTFEESVPNPVPGMQYSTLEQPVQSFHWGDYTAKPDHKYTYSVVPLFGKPKNLQQGTPVEIDVTTESEDKGTHAIYFNRGVAGSQAYAVKFKNKDPDKVPDRKALIWLSRGLEEAMLKFIGQAAGARYGLRASMYEFDYAPVLEAFKKAADSHADVKIVYDYRQKNPKEESDKAIKSAGIANLMIKRKQGPSYISHNKFIILLVDNKPVQVWTGSTNVTKSGIFGQSNVGHLVRDEKLAAKYLEYWKQLANDAPVAALKVWNMTATPDPQGNLTSNSIIPIFSPRKTAEMLTWYGDKMDQAKETVCLTAAFGVNTVFEKVLSKDKDYCRYLILEKKGEDYDELCTDPDVGVAIGAHLKESVLDKWTKEKLTGYGVNVLYIHTKFLLVDPLGKNPVTITGSANFSDPSLTKNDENALIIAGDTRVADIYFGEFMRLFYHFYFRYVANNQKARVGSEARKSAFLKPDESWTNKYYQAGETKQKERVLLGRDLS